MPRLDDSKSTSAQPHLPGERWNLFLNLELHSTPWPWPGKAFDSISPADILDCHADSAMGTTDFLRYSPTDGITDWPQVPLLPREAPVCRTRLVVHHDATHLFVFIHAEPPSNPILELAGCLNEDYCVAVPSPLPEWGFYFGMNQEGEHIGCTQIWNSDVVKALSGKAPDATGDSGVMGWPGQSLAGRYDACVLPAAAGGRIACFCIERSLIGAEASVVLSVGRTCYATGEWVSWGAPIAWSPRYDAHGRVRFAESPDVPDRLCLRRLDMRYAPESETAVFEEHWTGTDETTMAPFRTGQFNAWADKTSFALNGIEKTVPLAPLAEAEFAVPDGWNRLEVMSPCLPVFTVPFEKVSGRVPAPSSRLEHVEMPQADAVRAAFERWHAHQENLYQGQGVWPWGSRKQTCLCHGGVFNIEPYLLAAEPLRQPIHEQRIRECCERALTQQKPEGWFPCTCSANTREPELGDGGAFTNGSVAEALALASTRLDEQAWLDAAKRAADYSWYRWENNQNYAAFVLWNLAALHELEPDAGWLDAALYLARNFVIRDIGPGGAQGGHNYFTGYANITLKGMARLLSVLPAAHPFHPMLKNKMLRFANQILTRQQPNGMFAARNRKFLGYQHPVPGLFFVAEALPEMAGRLAPALAAMTRAVIDQGTCDPESGLVLAMASRMIQQQTRNPTS